MCRTTKIEKCINVMHTDHRVHRQRESDFKNLKIFIDSSQKGAKGPDNSTSDLGSNTCLFEYFFKCSYDMNFIGFSHIRMS